MLSVKLDGDNRTKMTSLDWILKKKKGKFKSHTLKWTDSGFNKNLTVSERKQNRDTNSAIQKRETGLYMITNSTKVQSLYDGAFGRM